MTTPIEPKHVGAMNALAQEIDRAFNGDRRPQRVAFCLLLANFGDMDGGRVNYISNAERADMICMVKEWLARVEGAAIAAPSTRTTQ